MPRKARIIKPGATYHIYQRGNNKLHIFSNSRHKEFFLKQIREFNKIYDFQLLAYVVMNNHYHLLLKTNTVQIDKIMFSIYNVTAKYLNRELERTGHIFEGRYGSRLVENELYLIWLLRYIHRNPVRAGLCKSVDEYKWSSHVFYVSPINKFVNTDIILNMISRKSGDVDGCYKRLMNIEDDKDKNLDYKTVKNEFQYVNSGLLDETEIPNQGKLHNMNYRKMKSLIEILDSMKLDVKTKILLTCGCRARSITKIKIEFILEAIKNKHTYKEIGIFLNTSQTAVSNILSYYRIKVV